MSYFARKPLHVHLYSMIVALLFMLSVANAQTGRRSMADAKTEQAIALLTQFAERTGLSSDRPPQRYLWTDAFAVCNFLGLARATGEERYLKLALKLVDQVHHTLGQHRADDPRSGWISGLDEREGENHPTQGGLRIGKKLPERGANDAFDEQLEWERDGQYFHYLTKWMHALDQLTRSTGQPRFNQWARELAKTAYDAFTYLPSASGGPRRMYWKMSIDLTHALVPSMGQHDPLDGYITNVQLITTASILPETASGPSLTNETSEFAEMIKQGEWATADPLGMGGLLIDAYRVFQLSQQGATLDDDLLETLLSASLVGLQYYANSGELRQPAEYRLAFRELGLAIGLHAVQLMGQAVDSETKPYSPDDRVRKLLQTLNQFSPLREDIETFWRNAKHHRASTWIEHRDINEVMLATTLTPQGFLVLLSPQPE
jgi:hypothetical protein